MDVDDTPSNVTQSTCHNCEHLEQSIFDVFSFDVPQGQSSVPFRLQTLSIFESVTLIVLLSDKSLSLKSLVWLAACELLVCLLSELFDTFGLSLVFFFGPFLGGGGRDCDNLDRPGVVFGLAFGRCVTGELVLSLLQLDWTVSSTSGL